MIAAAGFAGKEVYSGRRTATFKSYTQQGDKLIFLPERKSSTCARWQYSYAYLLHDSIHPAATTP